MSESPESVRPAVTPVDASTDRPAARLGGVRRTRKPLPDARVAVVGKARRWLLIIAVMQLVFGFAMGMKHSKECDEALQHLAQFDEGEKVVADGKTYDVDELRAEVESERVMMFVVPFGLGGAFLVLWWWAKRAAVAALVSALLLFVTAHGIDAIADPKTIANGFVLKAFVVVGLTAGIKAALAQRLAERRAAERAAADAVERAADPAIGTGAP
jgi:small-conductance mechanosensitive channel